MSNSCRSSLVINAHLPIDQAGGRYCSDCGNNGSDLAAFDVTLELVILGVKYLLKKINCTCTGLIKEIDLQLSLIIRRVSVK
jgi:hypothetical protein